MVFGIAFPIYFPVRGVDVLNPASQSSVATFEEPEHRHWDFNAKAGANVLTSTFQCQSMTVRQKESQLFALITTDDHMVSSFTGSAVDDFIDLYGEGRKL